jgi:Hydrazine synthase alpha subunit middle domain
MRRASETIGFLAALAVVAIALLKGSETGGAQTKGGGPLPTPTPAPTFGWETKASQPGNPEYYQPAYPIVFVKAPIAAEAVDVTPLCRTITSTNTGFGYPSAGSIDCEDDQSQWVNNCGDTTSGGTTYTRDVILSTRDADEFNYHLGSDVVSATNPGVGNELWIYIPPYGQVKKLFPLPIHDTNNDIDFTPSVGSVVEPSLSEDGTKVYFSYFQDATENEGTLTQGSERIPRSGADMYFIDLAPLLANNSINPDLLPVTRLTFRTYAAGTHKQLAGTGPGGREADAMNPTVAQNTTNDFNNFGTVYLHPTEVRTRQGLYLAYASNKRRLANSNNPMMTSNYNLNLHFNRLNPDGTLGPEDNQFQYYTTTSAMSPTPLREGLAFSYQATTDDARLWHMQRLDSEGRWGSLIGFGQGDQLFHLGSFCVGDVGGLETDYFVALKYYNINNESFGSIWKQNLAETGLNTYDNPTGSSQYVPKQVGATELTVAPGASLSQDTPSPFDNSTGKHYGKFTTPRCGGVNQLYFAYTPTSANHRLLDIDCNRDIYRSHIGYRPNLLTWTPGPWNPATQSGHQTVIKRTNDDFHLLWPTPVLSWYVRSDGDVTQQYTTDTATKPSAAIDPGEPFALIGTSALWNTDRRPPECYLKPHTYFHPWGAYNYTQENDTIMFNQDTWTSMYTSTPASSCDPPPQASILGIAINLTSNKTAAGDVGYTTGSGGVKEAVRLLGIYPVARNDDDNNLVPDDYSFLATIPASVSIELHAIDSAYGMKLADVRSWHSLKPREARTNCGGCHQHDDKSLVGPIDFEGTYAQTHAPLDMVRSTPSIHYNEDCAVVKDWTTPDGNAAESYPEWNEIWPGMQQYCGTCHGAPLASPPPWYEDGHAALDWDDPSDGPAVYNQLVNRKFANTQLGALGSQLFWAARGHRTDGRPNSNSSFTPDYGLQNCGSCPQSQCSNCSAKHQWGFHYDDAHNPIAGRTDCEDDDQPYADWVFKVGKWIDNHTPRNDGTGTGTYNFDWYHPTADSVLVPNPQCSPNSLQVGWWDDTGSIQSLMVWLNNEEPPLRSVQGTILNGLLNALNPDPLLRPIPLPTVDLSDWIKVEVKDAAGNRQIYHKSIEQLVDECDLPPPHQPYP